MGKGKEFRIAYGARFFRYSPFHTDKLGLKSYMTYVLSHEIPQFRFKYMYIAHEKGHFASGNTVPLNSTYLRTNAFLVFAGCVIELREGKDQVHTGERGVTSRFEISFVSAGEGGRDAAIPPS